MFIVVYYQIILWMIFYTTITIVFLFVSKTNKERKMKKKIFTIVSKEHEISREKYNEIKENFTKK